MKTSPDRVRVEGFEAAPAPGAVEPDGGTTSPPYILVNTFSMGMLRIPAEKGRFTKISMEVYPLSLENVREFLSEGFKSYISHKGTAEFLSTLLNMEIPFTREPLILEPDYYHTLILVQVMTRLEEGKILSREEVFELYNRGLIRFYIVYLVYYTFEAPVQISF